MEKTTLKKNQKAEVKTKTGNNYSYQYIDIAQIHEHLEENDMRYYQYIERIDGDDYIMTVPQTITEDGELIDLPARRGCRVVDATLFGTDNPAQKQGSALTYARRYSLLMAFGLATEDDDAQSLSKPKEPMTTEQAKNYILTFGKHKGEKLINVPRSYTDWCLESEKINPEVKEAIKLIYEHEGIKILTPEEQSEKLLLTTELNELFIKTGFDRDNMYKTYNVTSDSEMTIEQLKDAITKLKKAVK